MVDENGGQGGTTLPAGDPDPLGSIGHYKLLAKIGEGGFGVVYDAEQTEPVHRRVALKVIKPGMDSKSVVARFEGERQALAVMDHPCIAKVFDGGVTDEGRPYFVMELVRGEPITDFCDHHRLTIEQRLELFIHVCDAVQHAHMKGVIHRDIKPSNVLAHYQSGHTPSGAKREPGIEGVGVKVIDFGVAKALSRPLTEKTLYTERGQMIGTPEYMSPEQAEMGGVDIDTRTDVYSLGVMLYELLTGALPFDGDELRRLGLAEILRMIREQDPPRPSTRASTRIGSGEGEKAARARGVEARALSRRVRGDLDWIVMKCLAKDRTGRYESASALGMDLRRYLDHEPTVAGRPSRAASVVRFARRHRVGLGVSAIIVVAALGTAGGLAYGWVMDERAEAATARERLAQALKEDALQASIKYVTELVALLRPDGPGAGVDSEEMVRAAIVTAQSSLADIEWALRARFFEEVGVALLGSRRPDLAIEPFQSAAEIRMTELGPDHLDTLNTRLLVGIAHLMSGQLDTAEPIVERVATRLAEVRGAGDSEALVAAGTYAQILQLRGNLDEAEAIYTRIVAASADRAEPMRDHRLGWMNNLSVMLVDRGKPGEAEPVLRELSATLEQVYSVGAATVVDNHGQALEELDRLEEAEARYRRAIELRTELHGPETDMTMASTEHLARVLRKLGRKGEALALIEPAAAIVLSDRYDADTEPARKAAFGVLFEFAQALKAADRMDEARGAAREARLLATELDSGVGLWTDKALALAASVE